MQEMVLRYGPDERWADAFRDEDEHRDAWIRNRNHFLALYRHGRRPQAWWQFESPIPYPGYDREQATLYQAGLLGEEEAASLVNEWRQDFERAQEPGFMYCAGFAKPSDTVATWLSGEAARKAHLKWAGVPHTLIRKWTAERRRRRKTIRKLAAAAEPAESAAEVPGSPSAA
jgi:hypothetical protein